MMDILFCRQSKIRIPFQQRKIKESKKFFELERSVAAVESTSCNTVVHVWMLLRDFVMTNFNPTKLALEDVDAHLRYHRFNIKFACADSFASVVKERVCVCEREREGDRESISIRHTT